MPSIRPMHTGCGSMCMDVYKVKIYPAAKQDLLEIIDHLNTLSPSAALRYYDLLTEQIAGYPTCRNAGPVQRTWRWL